MRTQKRLIPPAELLEPPRGYRPLAWFGLIANVLAIPLALAVILLDPIWRTTNIAVGSSAVLPAAVLGIVSCVALLRWRHWGQVLAIIALSLSLAIALPYGIVRLTLVEQGRQQLAVLAPLMWALNTAILVFWCRPGIRHYLR